MYIAIQPNRGHWPDSSTNIEISEAETMSISQQQSNLRPTHVELNQGFTKNRNKTTRPANATNGTNFTATPASRQLTHLVSAKFSTRSTMNFLLLSVLALVSGVQAALTFTLGAHENVCFGIFTEKPNTPISYYFAVQSGGSFDVDYIIKDPRGEILVGEDKQRQADFILNGINPGEYELCFSNKMSTYAEKIIDFEIKFDNDANEFKANMPDQPNAKPIAHVENMQRTVDRIDSQLDGLLRTIQYYKTRNNRNQATVKSTESRIYYFSIFEVLLMVGMAFLQITVVQLFFRGSRKQLV